MDDVAQNCPGDHYRFASCRAAISADVDRYLSKSSENIALGKNRKRKISAFLTPELQCLAIYRLSHFLHVRGWRRLASFFAKLNFVLHRVCLPATSCIGSGCRLSHPAGVIFRGNAGTGLTLFGMTMCYDQHDPNGPSDALNIGNNVTIGAHAVVTGPVTIGSNSMISAFAVVKENVAADSTVASTAMRSRLRSSTRVEQ